MSKARGNNAYHTHTASDLKKAFFRVDRHPGQIVRQYNGGFPYLGPKGKIVEDIPGVDKFIERFWGKKTKMPVLDREVRGVSFVCLVERFEGKHGVKVTSCK
jgi:hypothetical protein